MSESWERAMKQHSVVVPELRHKDGVPLNHVYRGNDVILPKSVLDKLMAADQSNRHVTFGNRGPVRYSCENSYYVQVGTREAAHSVFIGGASGNMALPYYNSDGAKDVPRILRPNLRNTKDLDPIFIPDGKSYEAHALDLLTLIPQLGGTHGHVGYFEGEDYDIMLWEELCAHFGKGESYRLRFDLFHRNMLFLAIRNIAKEKQKHLVSDLTAEFLRFDRTDGYAGRSEKQFKNCLIEGVPYLCNLSAEELESRFGFSAMRPYDPDIPMREENVVIDNNTIRALWWRRVMDQVLLNIDGKIDSMRVIPVSARGGEEPPSALGHTDIHVASPRYRCCHGDIIIEMELSPARGRKARVMNWLNAVSKMKFEFKD